MNKLLIGGAAVALTIALAPALAQPAPPTPPGVAQGTAPPARMAPPAPPAPPRMHMMVVSDRVVTRDEVKRHVDEMFAKLDANHDGFVTKEEIEAFHRRFASMGDMGRDMAERARVMAEKGREMGEMGRDMAKRMAEHRTADRAAMFDRLDTNHDGVISREEFMAAKPEMHERRMVVMRKERGPGAQLAPGAPPMPGQPGLIMRVHAMAPMRMHGMVTMHAGMHFGARLFEMADTNHDGRVSLAEAEAAALAHFDKADLNHDGRITPEERAQARALRREHRPS